MSINILDSSIINRISAGEVVESPFSIVKELLDNALDAGATKIQVSIKAGGTEQIVVKDNGKGIEEPDIKKAFLPHATSKIKDITDLESIRTLGFRGEALASISNVSQTIVTTKTISSEIGYSLNVFGDDFGELTPTSCENGTTFSVNNLFFNVPARKKFLKKPKMEENQITNLMERYILAHPDISFKYVIDGDLIYQTNGQTLFDAINCVYGNETTQNILFVKNETPSIKVEGYVSKVGFSKPNTTYQTLIINSRYVVDEIVSKAVYMAFEEYLMPRQFPFFVLNLTMPVELVDVNVHPSKMNVKFANPSEIYDLIYTAVRSAIFKSLNEQTEIKTDLNLEEEKSPLIETDLSSLKEITLEPNEVIPTYDKTISLKQDEHVNMSFFDKTFPIIEKNTPAQQTTEIQPKIEEKRETATENYVDVRNLSDFKVIGEIFNEFIVLEKDDNMILLDFHAGHERLNYDKFTAIVKNREVVSQDLLIPYVQDMSELEVAYILSLKPELSELGFDIDEFGSKSIIINTIPMQLKDINLKSFVDDLLHDMKNLKPEMNNEIKHYLMQKACKSSVKSGMHLTDYEINELLKNLDLKHPVLLCPHGRPILTITSKSQIEKWFKRIV